MKSLEELRREIDLEDKAIIEAFSKRIKTARQIGEYKKINGSPVLDKAREEAKIAEIKAQADDDAVPYIGELYEKIFELSRKHQEKPLFGVLGQHLPHTYSPQIHAIITDEYAYGIIEKEEDELEELWAQGRRGVYGGYNVTIPYKKIAANMCDELTPSAKDAGAVNTVVFSKDGKVRGANTDIFGFMFMLNSAGIEIEGKEVLVLGHGGAAAAVELGLGYMKAGLVNFCDLGEPINYDNIYDICSNAQVIINCTPVGMFPKIDNILVNLDKFPRLESVADVIYNPSRTRLLYEAQKRGLKIAGGLTMLVAQAVKSCMFFKGATTDEEAESMCDANLIKSVVKKLEFQMKNVTIIGMPGSGKSALAKRLSEYLGREMVDLDVAFTETYNTTPSEVIKTQGEDKFREMEHEVSKEYLKRSGLIVSCGGGIVTREYNYFPLRCNSLVIYNDRPLSMLASEDRPLTASKGVEKLYSERHEAYENLCDIRITVDSKETKEEYLDEAVRIFNEAINS